MPVSATARHTPLDSLTFADCSLTLRSAKSSQLLIGVGASLGVSLSDNELVLIHASDHFLC